MATVETTNSVNKNVLITPATQKLLQPLDIPDDIRIRLEYRESGEVNKVPLYFMSIWSVKGRNGGLHSYNLYKFMQRIPEKQIVNNRVEDTEQWMIGATEISAWIIDSLFPRHHLFFEDDYTKTHYQYTLLRLRRNIKNASNLAGYKNYIADRAKNNGSTKPWEPIGLTKEHKELCRSIADNDNWELQLHQKVGFCNMVTSEGYALHYKQGVGKTPPSVVLINFLGDYAKHAHDFPEDNRRARIIICTPKNVRYNWQSEINHFSHYNIKSVVINGDKIDRMKQYARAFSQGDEVATCIIISYDTIPSDWDIIGVIPWDLCITDEAHYYKNSETKRWKYICKLRDISTKRIALTGTPMANHIGDLWTQLEFLGQGLSGFARYESFRQFFCAVQQDESGRERIVGVKNTPFIKEILARTTMYVTKEEALPDLPKKVYSIHEVEMTKSQAELYENLASQMVVEVENMLDSAKGGFNTITTDHILTKMLRLAQITSGFVCYDPLVDPDTGENLTSKSIQYILPGTKVRALIDYIKDKDNEVDKALIWTNWIPSIHQIRSALSDTFGPESVVTFYGKTSDKDRKEAERRYNEESSCRFLVGNPAAGGSGLNLIGYKPHCPDDYDTNTTHVFYFSQDWSMIKREQSEDRPHRHGTRVQLHIIDLCVGNTIDTLIREVVTDKRSKAAKSLDVDNVVSKLKDMLEIGV